jgi:long-chain fatty acid transport protein
VALVLISRKHDKSNKYASIYGFGNLTSNYMMLQTGFSYAYKLSKSVSIGISPNFNVATLELNQILQLIRQWLVIRKLIMQWRQVLRTNWYFYQNKEGFKLD